MKLEIDVPEELLRKLDEAEASAEIGLVEDAMEAIAQIAWVAVRSEIERRRAADSLPARLVLTPEAFDAFTRELENPPEPSPELVALFRKYVENQRK